MPIWRDSYDLATHKDLFRLVWHFVRKPARMWGVYWASNMVMTYHSAKILHMHDAGRAILGLEWNLSFVGEGLGEQ